MTSQPANAPNTPAPTSLESPSKANSPPQPNFPGQTNSPPQGPSHPAGRSKGKKPARFSPGRVVMVGVVCVGVGGLLYMAAAGAGLFAGKAGRADLIPHKVGYDRIQLTIT